MILVALIVAVWMVVEAAGRHREIPLAARLARLDEPAVTTEAPPDAWLWAWLAEPDNSVTLRLEPLAPVRHPRSLYAQPLAPRLPRSDWPSPFPVTDQIETLA